MNSIKYQKFDMKTDYSPCGDQQQAIDKLTEGIINNEKCQVLLGVTGSGKTFTMANIIKNINKPTLVIAHNKTLAIQLCNEFRAIFPNNRVEYFVSYYDYYQPEAYMPHTDTYIEKEILLNEEIDRLRNSATASLGERNDVIIVASVSCIYGLGAPKHYFNSSISIRENEIIDRDDLQARLLAINYKRNDFEFVRGSYRIRGDRVEVFQAGATDRAIRIDFFDNQVEKISEINALTGNVINILSHISIFPASHFVLSGEFLEDVLATIKSDRDIESDAFLSEGKLIEAQRLRERVSYDIEMIEQIGSCSGIENYSRYFDGRQPGTAPYTLIDYFPEDFLMFIDESHITIPQIRAMYNGDFARKTNLVNYGFRLKAAFDNRPLKFDEFEGKINQLICVSATPADYELKQASTIAEQIIRPTGLVDPEVTVKPTDHQIDDLLSEINATIEEGGKTLITTLTIKMSEQLTDFLKERGIKVEYMHNEIDTLERVEIINRLRRGVIDVIVGINLLREGLDIPEVRLVAILDADKEGFLRSRTSLIQTIGRATRNKDGRVIMYADITTKSMQEAIDETNRRRLIQQTYNKEHNITPRTIKKDIVNTLTISKSSSTLGKDPKKMTNIELKKEVDELYVKMNEASSTYDFEAAILYREQIHRLRAIYTNRKPKVNRRKNRIEE